MPVLTSNEADEAESYSAVCSRALNNAIAEIHRRTPIAVHATAKTMARAYLGQKRWALDMLFAGDAFGNKALSKCTPDEGLERLAHLVLLPSYAYREARLKLRGAEIFFRYERRRLRREARAMARAVAAPFKLIDEFFTSAADFHIDEIERRRQHARTGGAL